MLALLGCFHPDFFHVEKVKLVGTYLSTPSSIFFFYYIPHIFNIILM